MGAWGYKPLDSDQALDWLGEEVTDPIGETIVNLLDDFDQLADDQIDRIAHEVRAAAFVVGNLNFFSERLFGDLHGRLAKALRRIAESNWADEWDHPEALKIALQEQYEALESGQRSTTLLDNLDKQEGI